MRKLVVRVWLLTWEKENKPSYINLVIFNIFDLLSRICKCWWSILPQASNPTSTSVILGEIDFYLRLNHMIIIVFWWSHFLLYSTFHYLSPFCSKPIHLSKFGNNMPTLYAVILIIHFFFFISKNTCIFIDEIWTLVLLHTAI